MSQRQVTLTNTVRDLTGAAIPFAPVTFQLLTPGGVTAIDGVGDAVQTRAVAITADINGAYSQAVDYPGDFQTAYQQSQIRVTENGIITDSPVGFAYASTIAVTSWYVAASTAGLVTMRLVVTTDTGAPAIGVGIHTALNQVALVTATGAVKTTQQVNAVTDGAGTVRFSLDAQSALNPLTTYQTITIDGESAPLSYTVPNTADNYLGAWSSATTYAAASGTSNGDVVLSGGVLYRCILAHTNHVPPNATYWAVVSGLPTDLITAHLTLGVPVATIALTQAGINSTLTPLVDDPTQSPVSLADDIHNLDNRTKGSTRTVSTDVTLDAVTDWRVFVDNSAGNRIITLPAESARHREYKIIPISSAHNVTVTAAGADTINGAGTFVLTTAFIGAEIIPRTAGIWVAALGGGGGGGGGGGSDATTVSTGVVLIRTTASGSHPIALTVDDLNHASGVAPLDGGSLVPVANLPVAGVSTLGVVRGDNLTITNSGGILTAVNTAGSGQLIIADGGASPPIILYSDQAPHDLLYSDV